MPTYPDKLYVAGSSLFQSIESDEAIDDDPRGIFLMWEEPQPHAKYIMGLDPTVGITGWNRALRHEGDKKTDNAAIEIFRVDALRSPVMKDGRMDIDPITKQPKFLYRDLQVGEYAAPCDAAEIAQIANVLGRIYAGDAEDQCELIGEFYPGPGILTLQELLRLNYMNLWQWQTIGGSVAEDTTLYGWRSYGESQRMLWYRARRHLMGRRAKVQSKFLLDEYSNAVVDVQKMRAAAAYGSHDDRIQAASMCFWAGHKWEYDPERSYEPVTEAPVIDYQRLGPGLGERNSYKDAFAEAMDGWE